MNLNQVVCVLYVGIEKFQSLYYKNDLNTAGRSLAVNECKRAVAL